MGKGKKDRFIKWSGIISTLSTTVLALTALITVYLTIAAWKAQQNVARPYFVLKESPKVDIGKEIGLELNFTNVGVHPAVDLSSETIIFDERLSGKPIHHDESAIVNEIPKDASASLIMTIPNNDIYPQQPNIDAHFVVVDLNYSDPILNKSFSQSIYLKWNGVIEGKVQSIVHVRVEEKAKISAYFQKHNIDLEKRRN